MSVVLHTGPCAQVSDEMLIMLTSAPTPPQMSTDSDQIPFGAWNNQHVQRAMVIRALVSQLRAAEGIVPVEESDLRRRAEEDLDKMVQEQDFTTLNLLLTIGYKLAENAAQNLASGGGSSGATPAASNPPSASQSSSAAGGVGGGTTVPPARSITNSLRPSGDMSTADLQEAIDARQNLGRREQVLQTARQHSQSYNSQPVQKVQDTEAARLRELLVKE